MKQVLLFVIVLFTVVAPALSQCIAPDESGTATIPSLCSFTAPVDQMHITDGLPPGSQLNCAPTLDNFSEILLVSGTPATGETKSFSSSLTFVMRGTGDYASYSRTVTIPNVACTFVCQPRSPGTAVQSFDVDFNLLQGQITGDPDFDLLRITAGTGFGMPSPGHTTLTRLPSTNWAVESFFDITYRIDFIGKPGGTFGGRSGSTTATIRMQQGSSSSGMEVPPVVAQDDSLPVLGSVMLDPSNTPLRFNVGGFFDIFTEISLDFSGSSRIALPTTLTTQTLTGTASVRRGGSGMYKNLPLEVVVNYTPIGSSGGTDTYDTEMLQLNISGGTLPGGVMIRESPTLATRGKVKTVRNTGNGRSAISSFFDIFTELSIDGGATWTPADNSIRLETKVLRAPVPVPIETVIPQGVSLASITGDPDFDLLRITNNTAPSPPAPPVGSTETYPLNASALVLFGGAVHMPSDVVCVVRATGTYADDTSKSFDTEMLQLSLSGGTLPAGVMIRESPTRASTGRTRSLPVHNLGSSGQDGVSISSFFDVFTELSIDGGATWMERTPTTLEFTELLPAIEVPPVVAADDSLPILGAVLLDPSNKPLTFHTSSGDDTFTDLQFDFSGSIRIAPPTNSTTQTLTGTATVRRGGSGMHKSLPLEVVINYTPIGSSGGADTYDTEMLQLNISGGTLPGGVMIRESPTLVTRGKVKTVRNTGNGRSTISSFFDIFTELSVDGGATWTPSFDPIRLEAKIKPTVLINRPDPPPALNRGKFIADLDQDGLPDLWMTTLSSIPSSPPVGGKQSYKLQSGFIYVTQGGVPRLANNSECDVEITHTFDDGSDQYFDTEMLQLDISGGTLPAGVMVRESPSRASLGRTSIRSIPENSSFEVSSFFDIFTELSIDGGSTWTPQPPATLEYRDTLRSNSGTTSACASVATYPNDLYPPAGMLMTKSGPPIVYSNGWSLRNLKRFGIGSQIPLPPLGVTVLDNRDDDCDGTIDDNSGVGFSDFHSTGTSSVRITHSSDNGDERIFDTEMLALSLTGNFHGQVLMIRESPTRASTGRTTIKPNGSGFRIGSFFDIFTEISVDGGNTWFPSAESMRVEQELLPEAHTFASSNFPPPGVYDMSPACSEIEFENGARLRASSFFDIFTDRALPPMGGGASSSAYAATGRYRSSVSLDGGSSFFDVFFDVSMMLQVTPTDSTPNGNFYDTEMLSLDDNGGNNQNWLFGSIRLRESPTRPSHGYVKNTVDGKTNTPNCSSFFDVFTEISLDGGQTWSPATSSMRMVLDSITNGSISGMKWHDVNGNGINDGEAGLANWKVVLEDTLGSIIDTVRTDVSGNYSFTDVPSGAYRVYEELESGWIQTGGSPAYGFMTAPGQDITGIDFGNFEAPDLTGYKFNDRNQNGTRDDHEEGLKDWEICLSPVSNPNDDVEVSNLTGTFSVHLNGLPPGEPVLGSVTGRVATKKYRKVLLQQGRSTLPGQFENGDIPIEMLALDLQGVGSSSGNFFDVTVKREIKMRPKGWDGTIKGSATKKCEFLVWIYCIVSPRDEASGLPTGKRTHASIGFTGDLDGDGAPDDLAPGTIYRSDPVTLYDDEELPAGTLDSLTLTIGEPATPPNPVCTTTDENGLYSFSPMLPGSWNVSEHSQPDWVATTYPPNPCVVTSGMPNLNVDFGNFRLSDTLKYRTFTYEQLREVSEAKPKKVPSNKVPNSNTPWYAPNTANLIDQILKDEGGFMQVGQAGKSYPWGKPAPYLRPLKQGDVWKTFSDKKTPYHVSPPDGPQPMNYNNKGGIISGWKKSIPPKLQNNVLIAELLTLQVNLEASDKGHTTHGLGSLVYTWPGPWGQDVTIDSLASYGDKIMTNGVIGMITPMPVNPTDYDSLYNAVRRINLAFASPVLDDTTTDGGWRAVPMKFKWKGTYAAYEKPFLMAVPGIAPRIRSTPEPEQLPTVYSLYQNYPNPFNPTTTINFDLPKPAMVTLKVYNMLGQEVMTLLDNESMESGGQDIVFNAGNLSSGVYFYRIDAQGVVNEDEGTTGKSFVSVKKMILLK